MGKGNERKILKQGEQFGEYYVYVTTNDIWHTKLIDGPISKVEAEKVAEEYSLKNKHRYNTPHPKGYVWDDKDPEVFVSDTNPNIIDMDPSGGYGPSSHE